MESHLLVNLGNAEVYNLKNKMMIQAKLCYSPSLGGQLILTLGSSYHTTAHKANTSRRSKDSSYHTPIWLASLVG